MNPHELKSCAVIIALDDDKRLRRALQIAQGIDFYRYEVKFKLIPSS